VAFIASGPRVAECGCLGASSDSAKEADGSKAIRPGRVQPS
jgi:hypothetical protein